MLNIRRIFTCIILSALFLSASLLMYTPKASASVNIKRLAGQDRYVTAIEISKSGWSAAQNAVLATGEDFPDALCAAPLAKQLDAPILLTGKQALSPGVESEIDRLGVENVYIIGGEGVVSKEIVDILKGKNISVTRLWGKDRHETSLSVADYMEEKFSMSDEIVVATGENFPDALSIAPVAAKKAMPIILTLPGHLPGAVKAYIGSRNITRSYIIGGTGVISSNAEKELPYPDRIWGSDRFATNTAILGRFSSELDFKETYLATGEDFPDALAGSALAPKTSSPVILVDKNVPSSTRNFVSPRLLAINEFKVLGGEGAVPQSVLLNLIDPDVGGTYPPSSSKTGGNTLANINNGGLAAEKDGWIYYRNDEDHGTLYKMRTDGTRKTKLYWDSVSNINVVGNYVYYISAGNVMSPEGGSGVYQVSINGSQSIAREAISTESASFLYVEPNNIVYYGFKNGPLFRWDRSEHGSYKRIVDAGTNYHIEEDWVYYIIREAHVGDKVYKVRTNGEDKTLVLDGGVDSFNIYGGKIYYINRNDKKLYRANLDGSYSIAVIYDSVYDMNIADGWIYYVNGSEGSSLYKMRIDGTDRVKLSSSIATPTISIAGGRIFYIAAQGEFKTIKVDSDGSDPALVNNDAAYLSKIDNGFIYYINFSDNNKIYKTTPDSTQRISLNQFTLKDIDIEAGYIYYSNEKDGGRLYKVKTDGTGNIKVSDDPADYINVEGDYVYYKNAADNSLYKVNINGTGKTRLSEDNVKNIIVDKGYVYYSQPEGQAGAIYRIGIDGSGKAKIADCLLGQMYISYNYLYYNDLQQNGTIYKVPTNDILNKKTIIEKSNYFVVKSTSIYVYEKGGMDYGNMKRYYTDGVYNGGIGIGGGLVSFIPGFSGEYFSSPLNERGGMISFLPDIYEVYYNSIFYSYKMQIIKTDGKQ